MDELRDIVLQWMQTALIGNITPNTRAVIVRFTETEIYFDAYISGTISEEDRECMQYAAGDIMDFMGSWRDFVVQHKLIRLDYPARIPTDLGGIYVLERYFDYGSA